MSRSRRRTDGRRDTGSAIYLYGSKGPGHANYSIQFDNFIIFFSASDSQTEYQQPLFGHTFNTSGTHFVSFTAHHDGANQWLDLDFITITVNQTDSNATVPSPAGTSSPSPTASPTISPPWVSEASSSLSATTLSAATTSPSTSNGSGESSTSKLTLVLAAVFGGIIAVALLLALGLWCVRRNRGRPDGRPALRVGTPGTRMFSSYKPPPSPPSFFGGPMSPASADVYSAHSPSSRTDPFHPDLLPTPDRDSHPMAQRVHGPFGLGDGRHSPFSLLSQGGATVLTAGSSAQLLNPHLRKTDEPPTHKQSDSEGSMGIAARIGRARSPLQRFRRSSDLPIYKQHRAHESESGVNALKVAAGLGPGTNTQPISEKPENSSEDVGDGQGQAPVPVDTQYESPRPPPLPPLAPLHAAHRAESDISSSSTSSPPRRPKRPADGLIDFIGSQLAHRLERRETAKKRRDDGNSERTNFLKV
ncbi:uncharacterized protein FOMMEDRAFT_18330 [Fomitiporia mediterranea MF3/22]|uniref:uncharacterized protein n=1 Tax=Fomitiporia mediterranea (strain MF3/22) TaxID=694068 RepID=UPI00044098D9|nr:uncharacterized protein FOMMEDRAFT_18330 [Fomitiporia mediterranea MF3/22]EJD06137.1 hypothetical protein FOMMEDRAFT_18330 [Fomitiporia mediterranea MF3/22]